MRQFFFAALAGLWLVDGLVLLFAPRWTIEQVRSVFRQSPTILRWEALSIIAGLILTMASPGLPYQPLWTAAGLFMVAKGGFLWRGPGQLKQRVVEWCLNREDIDYRFLGLALCLLAVLLFHALGWLGGS